MVNGKTNRSQFLKNRKSMVDGKTDGQHFLPHLFQKSRSKQCTTRKNFTFPLSKGLRNIFDVGVSRSH